ncbi:MAG TPA: hypothetical protein VFQ91_15235 [Bryobacteraceae bacterium]|nr:hypothetical protein [Bryobacteraceae bacterium]
MHRDYMTTGPMVGLGFTRVEMIKYNFTDEELKDHFSPSVAENIARTRDELICGRLVWRNTIRFFTVVFVLMVLLFFWLLTSPSFVPQGLQRLHSGGAPGG